MSSLLQLSLDGKRFHGRWNESIGHCITTSEFNSELRRINCEYSRHWTRGRSLADISYALPFICIPFGILLIVLAFQQEKWPFTVAGIVLCVSGVLGMVLFRSSLGMVLCLCGSVLAVIPYADKTPWICVTIGTILAIFGCVGLMSLALRNNNHLRSTKMLTILLPIAAAFFCLPAANLEYPFVMICSGVTLIIAGVIAGAMVYSNSSRQCLEALEDLRIVIDQLNSRYQNKLQWTLIERLEEPRGKMDRTIEVLLEDISQMGNAGKKQHYQPAHVQVTIENNNAAPSPGKNDRTPYESQSQT